MSLILDIECYKNYFLIMFYNPENDQFLWFEQTEEKRLDTRAVDRVLASSEIVTFNGNNYDIPVLSAALRGWDNRSIREVSDGIIMQNLKPWQVERKYGPNIRVNHIDVIEVAPGMVSLKIYGGRLRCAKMQDLPIEPDALLTNEEMLLIREYCKNDVRTTAALFASLKPQIDLRRQMSETYGQDLRSKSDAQIAEAVIVNAIGIKIGKSRISYSQFTYQIPHIIKHLRSEIKDVLTLPFTVKANGVVEMPNELEALKITIGNTTYQMGMGGLHSTEKSVCYQTNETHMLCDWDVASYYPSIILNLGLYPPQMGEAFLQIYRNIVDERLEAKRSGDKVKADSLKIVVNGSFGKLGSPYSALYSPHLLVQVTVTGQLALLQLIEWMEGQGIRVVSGNTDGIVLYCPRDKEDLMIRIIRLWERVTGFEMERTDYKALYSRDVNNYLAVKPDGKVKTKGIYATSGLSKNPTNEICVEAVIAYLTKGIPPEETIRGCQDITKFVSVRSVKGGAVKDNALLGKAVRWYYGRDAQGYIAYKVNGNKVPRSDGAVPLMDLPDSLPTDIDYNWYINEVSSMLTDLGAI